MRALLALTLLIAFSAPALAQDYKTLLDKYDKFRSLQSKNPQQAWMDSYLDQIKRPYTDKGTHDYAFIFSEWE